MSLSHHGKGRGRIVPCDITVQVDVLAGISLHAEGAHLSGAIISLSWRGAHFHLEHCDGATALPSEASAVAQQHELKLQLPLLTKRQASVWCDGLLIMARGGRAGGAATPQQPAASCVMHQPGDSEAATPRHVSWDKLSWAPLVALLAALWCLARCRRCFFPLLRGVQGGLYRPVTRVDDADEVARMCEAGGPRSGVGTQSEFAPASEVSTSTFQPPRAPFRCQAPAGKYEDEVQDSLASPKSSPASLAASPASSAASPASSAASSASSATSPASSAASPASSAASSASSAASPASSAASPASPPASPASLALCATNWDALDSSIEAHKRAYAKAYAAALAAAAPEANAASEAHVEPERVDACACPGRERLTDADRHRGAVASPRPASVVGGNTPPVAPWITLDMMARPRRLAGERSPTKPHADRFRAVQGGGGRRW